MAMLDQHLENAMRAKRARTPGCDYLAMLSPHPADDEDISFVETTHTYTFRGVQVEKSCTALVSENFEIFDAWVTVQKFYERWKLNQDNRYWDIIARTCAETDEDRITDDEAQRRIVARWEALADEASRKGTLLHTYCERVLNVAPDDPPLAMAGFVDIAHEVAQHAAFMRSDFIAQFSLSPYATELLVWYTVNDEVVSAGQVDAVMRSRETGAFFMIDWKRVNSKHKLTVDEACFGDRYGCGHCWEIPDTHFHRYSLQCSIYATMLMHSHGIDVGDRLFLERMHEDRNNYQIVHCYDWRSVARSLLQVEHTRLMAKRGSCFFGRLRVTEREV